MSDVHTRQMHALGRIAVCAILQPLRHALSAVVGVTVGCMGVTPGSSHQKMGPAPVH